MEQTKQAMTARQAAWLASYLTTLDATKSARLTYECSNPDSYKVIGHENVVKFRAEIDRRLREVLAMS